MKSRLTAFVTIVALALAGISGTQAEARSKKSNTTIALLLGAVAAAVLLNQANQGRATQITPRPDPRYPDRAYNNWDDGYNDWDDGYAQSGRAKRIPAECVMDVTVNGRNREVISARCVTELGLSRRLPAECAFNIRTRAGTRTVYGPQCLRDYGYRVEQARY